MCVILTSKESKAFVWQAALPTSTETPMDNADATKDISRVLTRRCANLPTALLALPSMKTGLTAFPYANTTSSTSMGLVSAAATISGTPMEIALRSAHRLRL